MAIVDDEDDAEAEGAAPKVTAPAHKRRRTRELAAAAALLLLENRSQRALRTAITTATTHLAGLGATQVHISEGVRVASTRTVTAIHHAARKASLARWTADVGLPVDQTALAVAADMRAAKVGESLAAQWRSVFRKVTTEDPTLSMSARAKATTKASLWRADRVATTEAVHAWNDETRLLNEHAAIRHGLVLVETWSAMLDACPMCSSLDGTTAESPDLLAEYPPLHSNCRCVVLTHVRDIGRLAA